jgi:hypothetical protein
VLCGEEFGAAWVRWLVHAHERHGRALSLLASGEHLATLLGLHKAGGVDAVREAVLWSIRNNCRFPEPAPARKGGNVVAFAPAGQDETAKLRGMWVSFVRGCVAGEDPLERLRDVNPAMAAKIPAEWVAEANEALEG